MKKSAWPVLIGTILFPHNAFPVLKCAWPAMILALAAFLMQVRQVGCATAILTTMETIAQV